MMDSKCSKIISCTHSTVHGFFLSLTKVKANENSFYMVLEIKFIIFDHNYSFKRIQNEY